MLRMFCMATLIATGSAQFCNPCAQYNISAEAYWQTECTNFDTAVVALFGGNADMDCNRIICDGTEPQNDPAWFNPNPQITADEYAILFKALCPVKCGGCGEFCLNKPDFLKQMSKHQVGGIAYPSTCGDVSWISSSIVPLGHCTEMFRIACSGGTSPPFCQFGRDPTSDTYYQWKYPTCAGPPPSPPPTPPPPAEPSPLLPPPTTPPPPDSPAPSTPPTPPANPPNQPSPIAPPAPPPSPPQPEEPPAPTLPPTLPPAPPPSCSRCNVLEDGGDWEMAQEAGLCVKEEERNDSPGQDPDKAYIRYRCRSINHDHKCPSDMYLCKDGQDMTKDHPGPPPPPHPPTPPNPPSPPPAGCEDKWRYKKCKKKVQKGKCAKKKRIIRKCRLSCNAC